MTFDELKAKYAAMTPGPWEVRGHYVCVGRGGGDKQETGDGRLGEGGVVFSAMVESATEQNFPGIVALHNAFPGLVERYEAMREALERIASDEPFFIQCGGGIDVTASMDAVNRANYEKVAKLIAAHALALVAKPLTEDA